MTANLLVPSVVRQKSCNVLRAKISLDSRIQKCGGLAEAKKIADLAHTYYVPIAPHCQASPIGMMAACHAMSTVPNFLVQEWHWGHPAERTARWKEYVEEGDIIQKGYITVPDKPGIGLTINDEALRKLARPNSPWFPA